MMSYDNVGSAVATADELRIEYHLLFARLGRHKAEIAEAGLSAELARADELLCRVIVALSERENKEDVA